MPPPDAAASTTVQAYAFSGFRVVPIQGQGNQQSSEGFDIDGTATAVCGHPDLPSPAGVPGIDNQFALLWLRFAAFLNRSSAAELDAMNQILNAAPAQGSMLMAVFVERAPGDDQGVRVRVQPLANTLLTGADDQVLPFQTVVRDSDFAPAPAAASEVGSVITSVGVDFTLPFQFFGFDQTLEVTDSHVRIERLSDSSAVAYFAVREAAGVVIATPEYNYGIPGPLKNALDWLSRPGFKSVFAGKRVAVISVSPSVTGGVRAQGALKTVLGGMVAQVFPFPEVTLAGAFAARGDDGGLADAGSRERVATLVNAFVATL